MGMGTSQALNQEMDQLAAGLSDARRITMGRLTMQARDRGACGIVGVAIDQSAEAEGRGPARTPERMIFTFTAVGTAIIEKHLKTSSQPVQAAVNLGAQAERIKVDEAETGS